MATSGSQNRLSAKRTKLCKDILLPRYTHSPILQSTRGHSYIDIHLRKRYKTEFLTCSAGEVLKVLPSVAAVEPSSSDPPADAVVSE